MDLFEAIHERRSVRAFLERGVPRETTLRLIEAAIQAPSALNLQPWAFVVLEERGLLGRVSARSKRIALARLAPGDPLWNHRDLLADPAYDVFHGAPLVIVVCAAPGAWPTNEDCCLAAQNLLLAAHGLGLGACPIGLARAALEESKAELRIPADHTVVMPIAIGFPREQPHAPPRRAARILAWK